jgi:hypothetical protein
MDGPDLVKMLNFYLEQGIARLEIDPFSFLVMNDYNRFISLTPLNNLYYIVLWYDTFTGELTVQ